MRKFIYEHSLSLTLLSLGVLTTYISSIVEHGTWAYDFWMMLAGVFLGGAIIAIFSAKLWEKGADPSKCPDDPESTR